MKDDKCFAVRCLDGMFCQTGSQPAPHGMNVKLAYMNRGGAEKEKGARPFVHRSYMIYIGKRKDMDLIFHIK